MPKSPLPSGGNTTDEKEKTKKAEEVRQQSEVDSGRVDEGRILQESSKQRVSLTDRYGFCIFASFLIFLM